MNTTIVVVVGSITFSNIISQLVLLAQLCASSLNVQHYSWFKTIILSRFPLWEMHV